MMTTVTWAGSRVRLGDLQRERQIDRKAGSRGQRSASVVLGGYSPWQTDGGVLLGECTHPSYFSGTRLASFSLQPIAGRKLIYEENSPKARKKQQ